MIYWEDAFQTATYIISRLPTPVLHHKSPSEILHSRIPDYRFLRVIGCACWPNLQPYNINKLNFRSKTCIFIGYSLCHQGYKCLDLSTGKIYVSHNVIFNETLFPYSQPIVPVSDQSSPSTSVSLPHHITVPQFPCPIELHPNHITTCTPSAPLMLIPAETDQAPPPTHSTATEPALSPIISPATTPVTHPDTLPVPTNIHSMVTRSKNNIHRPRQSSDDFIRYPLPKALTAALVPTATEPTSYSQASKFVHWREAMNQEFSALLHNGTWSLVSPPTHVNIVGCRWIYKIKRKADGAIEHYKARLVAKGFHQREGVDFSETFSPVIKHATIRLVISIAVTYKWPIKQLDVQNAFLHSDLHENVFMLQPQGYVHPQYPNYVCKLHKSLYGLRQTPRSWFSKLSTKLLSLGFSESKADTSLFVLQKFNSMIYILIYVDDILITSSSASVIHNIIHSLQTTFAVKDLGSLAYFLGVEALWCTDGMYLTQRKYIADLLKRSKMENVKPCTSPMASNCRLTSTDGTPFEDISLYRSIVGSIQYLTFTRPDLAFDVHKVSKFMHNPLDTHW